MTSRNTLLKQLLKPTLALSLIERYYYIDINANVNYLMNFVMDNIYSKILLEGGGVKSLLFHTVPPTIKTCSQNLFHAFS